MPDTAPITPADTVTPFYTDKAFLLVVANLIGVFVAALFKVQLDPAALAADALTVIGFVVSHKVKSGTALLALIKAEAEKRYMKQDPAPALPEVASALDKPVSG